MSQAQPVRAGDVCPPSAADQEARRERDMVIGHGRDQHDGGLQVMAQFTIPVPDSKVAEATDAITIGEALQAAGQTSAGDKRVDLADAAAVQAAEMRTTGLPGVVPGGVAAVAQQGAETNMKPAESRFGEDGKVRLRDVVGDAASVLPANKVATREDAEKVAAAAARNVGNGGGAGSGRAGIAEAVAAAADMNEGRMM